MKSILKTVFFMAVAIIGTGCSTVPKSADIGNGITAVSTKDKDAIGPNYSGVALYDQSWKNEAPIYRLESMHSYKEDSWEQLGGGTCPKQMAKRNIRHKEGEEKGYQDVLNPARQAQPPAVIGGSGPGPLDNALPAAFSAAGEGAQWLGYNPEAANTFVGQFGGGAQMNGSGNSRASVKGSGNSRQGQGIIGSGNSRSGSVSGAKSGSTSGATANPTVSTEVNQEAKQTQKSKTGVDVSVDH